MASPQFPNYLLAHRKRLALSQNEVAYLLGVESGAKVSRHERFARDPSLDTILAYEAIFQKPGSELFAGRYQEIEQEIAARARRLAGKMDCRKPTQQTTRKLQTLANLAAGQVRNPLKQS